MFEQFASQYALDFASAEKRMVDASKMVGTDEYRSVLSEYCDVLVRLGSFVRLSTEVDKIPLEVVAKRLRISKAALRKIMALASLASSELQEACLEWGKGIRTLDHVFEAYKQFTGATKAWRSALRSIRKKLEESREAAVRSGYWDDFNELVLQVAVLVAGYFTDDMIEKREMFRQMQICSGCGAPPPPGGWESFWRDVAGRKIEVAICPSCSSRNEKPRMSFVLMSLLDYSSFLEMYSISLRSRMALQAIAEEFDESEDENVLNM